MPSVRSESAKDLRWKLQTWYNSRTEASNDVGKHAIRLITKMPISN